ncbi:hypothetical protein BLD49_17410 [Erwinia sp. OLMDSP33]|nr:hypothetical protein BV501_10025 [Erwinia sp. OAMSP11]PIJ71938.1 hypothetical protein BK416_10670 [Erwinia sp. OLSSP12]PIJ79524.1 hypothetical protein BLD49_17410 [Erwinia sp. OLMDSP33]PIJ80920.1 hypothetical protein BLD47_10150 [Erwinia sp. OLCASP19]PIJ83825.1 hypothetical protein BLD46_09075 [Erwinia sp. OLMTSP26]PIJ93474.1 hypothetical protein BL249_04345 [Erwinia sp. OLFS4]
MENQYPASPYSLKIAPDRVHHLLRLAGVHFQADSLLESLSVYCYGAINPFAALLLCADLCRQTAADFLLLL